MDRAMSLADPELFSFELTQPFSASLPLFDRREVTRHVLRVRARISPDGHLPLDTHTVDLSAHGLSVTSARPLNVDQECSVELGINAPILDSPPALRARVRYCARLPDGQFRIGMQFTDLSIEAAEGIVAALGL